MFHRIFHRNPERKWYEYQWPERPRARREPSTHRVPANGYAFRNLSFVDSMGTQVDVSAFGDQGGILLDPGT